MRKKFVFKIVPMLNPDGVIVGNSRLSLLGIDEFRRWQKPSKFLHPTIYYAKSLIKYYNKKLQEENCKAGGVLAFFDVHGHHRKDDVFMYGSQVETEHVFYEAAQFVKAIPDCVDRVMPVFNTRRCRFNTEPDKLQTSRVVLSKELQIPNAYTLLVSFNGSD